MQYGVRDENVVRDGGLEKTLSERWNTNPRPGHWYGASTDFAVEHLGNGAGRSCLVIGSPMFEATTLGVLGWDVTYMDIRVPPVKPKKFIQCDAMGITLPDESFDAVSSACVLTHVGTGRYGDGVKPEHGDEKMLAHVARILKKGGIAALTFGAVADLLRMQRTTAHRIYTVHECLRMLAQAELVVRDMRIWSVTKKDWLPANVPPTTEVGNPDYISFAVVK